MRKYLIILITGIAAILSGADLVTNGVSDYWIVVEPEAKPVALAAAEDLRLHIEKATGAKLPLKRRDELKAGGKAIIVGEGKLSREAGIDLEKLPPESFVVKVVNGNLYIAGKDTANNPPLSDHWRNASQAGTWHGVSVFLERFLDIRWFMPGDLGAYIPAVKTLSVADNYELTQSPKMEYRRINYLHWSKMSKNRRNEVLLWERRNRNGWSVDWNASHSWVQFFKSTEFFEAHPEWFALVNGKRLAYAPHGIQMCTSNPGALDKFAEIIVDYVKRNPGMFTLTPNDGANHCECETCRALDVETLPDGTPSLTDRYVTYCNEIAGRVNKVLPDQKFGFYAYSFYMRPPQRVKLNPNVQVMHVLNDNGILYYSDQVRKEYLENMLLPWRSMVGRLYYYATPEGMGNILMPSMHPQAIRNLYTDLEKAGVSGIVLNNGEPFPATGLNNYLYLKMAWEPAGTFDMVYKDALAKCYGPAAVPAVKKYTAELERRIAAYCDKVEMDLAMGSANRRMMYETIYDGFCEAVLPGLEAALEQATDRGQYFRLKLLVDNLKFCGDSVLLYKFGNAIKRGPTRRKVDILTAQRLATARDDYIAGLERDGWSNPGRVQDMEAKYSLPFSTQAYLSYLGEVSGGVNRYGLALVKTPEIIIDGRDDEAVWQKIPAIQVNRNKDTGDEFEVRSEVKLFYDQSHIYIYAYAEEPSMSKVKDVITGRGGKVWNENEFEFFFDTANRQREFYQICVNSLGGYAEFEKKGDKTIAWNSGAEVRSSRTEDSWSIELKIPLKNIGTGRPKLGTMWGFNAYRIRRNVVKPPEYSSWSPPFGGFGSPERFGKLMFK